MPELYAPETENNHRDYEKLNMKEVFRIIDKYFRTKGFDKKITFDEEYQTDKGKYIHVKSEHYKKTDSYVRLQTRLWIYANELVDVEKEVDGVKIKTGHGKLSITFDAFLQTEYFSLMDDKKPMYFLFRVLYEQYLARPRIVYWENVARHVVTELKTELAGYLNLNKFLYER